MGGYFCRKAQRVELRDAANFAEEFTELNSPNRFDRLEIAQRTSISSRRQPGIALRVAGRKSVGAIASGWVILMMVKGMDLLGHAASTQCSPFGQ